MFEDFNPGELNKRISIVRPAVDAEQDSWGFSPDDGKSGPETILSCWARVTDESGAKALENGTEFSVARRRFLIRHTSTEITTDMYVQYKGDLYAIVRPPSTFGDSGRFVEIWTERKEHV